MAIKHVGRMINNRRKVVVAYRVVPNEPENCVVVTTENLEAADHDALIKSVESDAGQQADEFAEVMTRTRLSDGRNMLAAFHTTGKMVKVPSKDVEMTPDLRNVINLSELNNIIAQQKGVTVNDLALQDPTPKRTAAQEVSDRQVVTEVVDFDKQPQPTTTSVPQAAPLTDADIAAQYRSDADRLSKEAAVLRRQAEDLVPTKKKVAKKTTASGQE
jgi:hypothetical protein|tara:strand:- start:28306 stop:28953 length:648 start_codon:yes stop_codon:yes gene_type:complete